MSAGELAFRRDVPLSSRTTIELGGNAERLFEARDAASLVHALAVSEENGWPVAILGGGSNTLVPDEGVSGLVIVPAMRGIRVESERGGRVRVRVAAGERWDDFVAWSVANGLSGVECLSGIPGSVGATPIQNVGAYGQEVARTILEVVAVERATRETVTIAASECRFAYRDSRFKREPHRFVVVEVVFELGRGAPARPSYAELDRALPEGASLATIRETVIRLRRAKSMVITDDDPNRRSVGSFFTNPIVDARVADETSALAVRDGFVARAEDVPRWPAGPARTKLSAGWLIERSGLAKGIRRGPVGLSSVHALALVHHGGGTTRELLSFADEVREAVRARWGVELEREPVVLSAR